MGDDIYFADLNEGDYRVYVSALRREHGYVAALLVSRIRGVAGAPKLAFCDFALRGGRLWSSAADALAQAASQGERLVWNEPAQLAC
jgi:hypothetical protein